MRKLLLAVCLTWSACAGASGVPEALAAGPAALPAAVSGAAIVQYAMKYLGYPYTATGNSPSTGFSCIGFVSYVYNSLGITLPGDLSDALAYAPQVSFSQLEPGDVLYFQNTVWAGLSHAAIYIGGGKFIHAEWYNRGVVISSFSNDPVDGNYWTGHYMTANRPWTGAAGSAPLPPPTVQAIPSPQPTLTPTPIPPVLAAPPTRHRPSGPAAMVTVPALNVRSSPSLQATIETVVTRGTSLDLLGRRAGWYRVALPSGLVGWVVGMGIGKGAAETQLGAGGEAAAGANENQPIVNRKPASRPLTTLGMVTVRVNGLRVHSGPSLAARVIAAVNRGRHLPIVHWRGTWIQAELSSAALGWVSAAYVQTNSVAREPTGRVAATRATVRRSVSREPRVKVGLNVRAEPSLAGAIVTVLPPGGAYRVLHWSNGWANVLLAHGVRGWISGTVLSANSYRPAPRLNSRASTVATRRRSSSLASRSPSRSSMGRAAAAPGATVARAALNVRESPSLGAAIGSVVPPGGSFTILARANGWDHVRLADGGTGWIDGSVLGPTTVAATPSATQRVSSSIKSTATNAGPVITATVRVHSGPGLNSPAVRLATRGTHVQVLGSIAGWTRVRLPNRQTGYVLGVYVRWS